VRIPPGERPVAEKAEPSKVVDSKAKMASDGGSDVIIQRFGVAESLVSGGLV